MGDYTQISSIASDAELAAHAALGNPHPGAMPLPANVRVVQDGDDLPTIMTAASAAYVSTGIRQLVVLSRGVKTDYVEADGVDVIVQDNMPKGRASGRFRSYETSMAPIPLSYPGLLVSCRADDCYDTWLTADAVFGGLSALAYSAKKGVIWNHGVIASELITPVAGKMTAAQNQIVVERYAGTRVCHTYNHDVGPTTQDELDLETIHARDIIEHLAVTGTPTLRIGDAVNGFYQPGTWGTSGDAANIAARMDNWADYDSWIGRHIRATFPWSGTDAINSRTGVAFPKHFGKYLSLLSGDGWATLDGAKALLHSFAYPGNRLEVLVHNPLADANIKARIKNFVDALAAIRDDKTAYPYRTVHSVTAAALRYGVQPAATYDATNKLQIPAGQVVHETFDDLTLGGLTLPWRPSSVSLARGSGNTGTVTIADEDSARVAQVASTGTGNFYVITYIHGGPGRYLLSIRCKSSAPRAFDTTGYTYYDAANDADITELSVNTLPIGTHTADIGTAMGWVHIPFFMADYSNGRGYVQINVPTGTDVTIDTIDVSFMGN
jgi:hypothetical protein